jgi:hypothetical protein
MATLRPPCEKVYMLLRCTSSPGRSTALPALSELLAGSAEGCAFAQPAPPLECKKMIKGGGRAAGRGAHEATIVKPSC